MRRTASTASRFWRRASLRVAQRVALSCAVVAVAVLAVSVMAWRSGDQRADDRLGAAAAEQLALAMRRAATGVGPAVDHAWITDADGPLQKLGTVEIEPPWNGLTQEAVAYETRKDFSENGRKFAAFGRPWKPGQGVVSVIELEQFQADRSSSHRRIAGAAFAALVVGTTIVEFLRRRGTRGLLAQMDRQRSFLADAAHEMRTPLAIIQASSSQALARSRTSEEYVRSLSEIRSAAERATTGVGELLELARLESGRVTPTLAPLRLDLLGEEVAAANTTETCDVLAPPCEPVVVAADAPLLRQAIDNLVRNAVRRSSAVSIVSSVEEGRAVLRVRDNGPGFDPKVVGQLFQRFGRFDEKGSAGLGLSIVAAVVRAHNGNVCASNHPDGGAELTITLPVWSSV